MIVPPLDRLSLSTPRRRRWFALGLGFALAVAVPASRAEPAPALASWGHIKTALLFTGDDVDALLSTPALRQTTLAYFAPLRITKIYVSNDRAEPTAVGPLRAIAADLKARGYAVSGVVVPAGERGPLAYNDPRDMAMLEGRVRVLAQVFDEIIVDDWLFTTSTSAQSVADRGHASWADYRSQLVAEQSKRHLIDAAKQVNPNVQVIIKFPNWYEGHRRNGYDVARQTPQFDGVSVGIETRQPTTQDQHIPTYSGYVYQRWIGGQAGPKWRSAWLDNYGMQGADDDYIAEVWQAVLARAPEIIFWCAGQLHPPVAAAANYPRLVEVMPDFDRLAGLLDGPARGIPIHLPLGAVGEYNLFGYFGMIGLPMAPAPAFPTEPAMAIFTDHSRGDPNLAAELLARLRAGKEVFLTWPLFQRLRGGELGQALEVIRDDGTVAGSTFRVPSETGDGEIVAADRTFVFPKIEVSTWPDSRQIALVREDADFGVFLRTPYLGGQLDLLNLPDNRYDLERLPASVLNGIRQAFFPELGAQLEGPGGVALYPFGTGQYVLYNMTPGAVAVALRVPAGAGAWQERMHDAKLAVSAVPAGDGPEAPPETRVALTLRPFEIALLETR